MRMPFGPWTPDRPSQAGGDGALAVAKNCIPDPVGYRPLPALHRLSSSASFDGYATGIGEGYARDGSQIVVLGAGKRLYLYNTNGTLTDVSKGTADYGLTPGLHRWRFAFFNSYIIAVNGIDPPQRLDLTTADGFDDLAGEPPVASFICVIRNYVVLADTIDPTDGHVAYRIWWCAPDNQESWAPDISTGAGFRDMADVGSVLDLTGGEIGHVLCQGGLIRAYPSGSTQAFQFDVVERSVAPLGPHVATRLGAQTFFLGQAGVVAFDGGSATQVGLGKVDEWLKGSLDLNGTQVIAPGVDRENKLALWGITTAGWSTRPNTLLILNVATGQFSYADVETEAIGDVRTVGLTLDDDAAFPNLDAFEGSLDDPRLWTTGRLSGVAVNGSLYGFTGLPMTATFETFDTQLVDGARSCLNRAAVLHDGGSPTLQIGTREYPQGALSWTASMSPLSDGFFRPRSFGRWHRVRAILSDQWLRAAGADIWSAPVGMR